MYQIEIKSVDIFIIYRNDDGREAFFADYWHGIDYLDMNKDTPQDFLNTLGGFSIRVNNINTIMRVNLFYILKNAIDFLLGTLYWLQNKENIFIFNYRVENNLSEVSLKTTAQNVFKICNHSQKEISISYTPNNNTPASRATSYFENIIIRKIDWYNATKVALKEYFDYAKKILSYDPNGLGHETLLEYYHFWAIIESLPFFEK